MITAAVLDGDHNNLDSHYCAFVPIDEYVSASEPSVYFGGYCAIVYLSSTDSVVIRLYICPRDISNNLRKDRYLSATVRFIYRPRLAVVGPSDSCYGVTNSSDHEKGRG